MINVDISKSKRYNLNKVSDSVATINKGRLISFERNKFCFSAYGELTEKLTNALVHGFAVNPLSSVSGIDLPLKLCIFSVNRDFGIVQRKDKEIMYLLGSSNVSSRQEPFNDFFMVGASLVGYDMFGENLFSIIKASENTEGADSVPMYLFTIPVPFGYCLYDSCLVVFCSLFVNLPSEVVSRKLSKDFNLIDLFNADAVSEYIHKEFSKCRNEVIK